MKNFITGMEGPSVVAKVLLALIVDIIWSAYRIARAVDTNNTTALIVAIVLLFVPFTWLIDLLMIITKGNAFTLA